MIAAQLLGLSIAEWAFVIAGALFAIDRILERTGRSPTVRTLREENVDLVRRNRELEEVVERHEQRIAELTAKVTELERSNQEAVLRAIERHEINAATRIEKTMGLLERIASSLEARGG